MPYQISWLVPSKVLHLHLRDEVSLEDFQAINKQVQLYTAEADQRFALVVDMIHTRRVSYNVEQIRASQQYAQDSRLDWILVVSSNKLLRLTMMVIFNLARAPLQLFQTVDEVKTFLKRIQYISPDQPPFLGY